MKRTMFKKIVDWTENIDFYGQEGNRVRVSDAREITPEKAIAETILRTMYLDGTSGQLAKKYLPEGYTATVKNGKVTVRKAK